MAATNMKKLCLLLLCCLPLAYGAHVTILRDEYGVPHIFAQDAAGAAFGSGYAQAEDRLEELLKNYRRAEGTMAEAFGTEFFRDDWRQRKPVDGRALLLQLLGRIVEDGKCERHFARRHQIGQERVALAN